jgi:glutathione S-transferase
MDSVLELYHAAHSTCSQKVRICLAEKGLAFKDIRVNLATNEHLSPGYLRLNPNGVVPTLVHDGRVVIDSSVICEYLDEVYPEPGLTPADPVERAKMRAWMRYLEEVPTAAVRVPSFNMAFLYRYEDLDDERFRATQSDIRPIRKHFYRRMSRKGFSKEDVEASLDQLDRTCARMDAALPGGPWLIGRQYTLADIVVAPLIDRMADLGKADIWEGRYPGVTDWYARMQARPAFQATFYPGARVSEFLKLRPLREFLEA